MAPYGAIYYGAIRHMAHTPYGAYAIWRHLLPPIPYMGIHKAQIRKNVNTLNGHILASF